MKPTQELHDLGQSLWLDNITRTMLDDGTEQGYIDDLNVTGQTSNPTIFDKAISGGDAYDEQIAELREKGMEPEDIFFELALADVTRAAKMFAPIHKETDRMDGWVSLEVSPQLAYDTQGTIQQAADLHGRAEENNFIKIPGTPEGLPAIEESIFAGVPINVTLLMSTDQTMAAADAYMKGIERRIEAGPRPGRALGALALHQPLGRRGPRRGARRAEEHPRRRRRQGDLCGVDGDARVRSLEGPRREGRAPAAPALRQHRDQGPGGLGHALYRGVRGARTPSTPCPTRP